MTESLRIVHYLNQYFGGIGGEEHANAPFQVQDGAVGPGRAVQQLLNERGSVVATFVCGDNYFVEERESTAAAIKEALRRFRPHVVLAGPAFDAGRYGIACAQMCAVAREEGIPAVTAMHHENPGYTTFRRHLLCLPTGNHASEMQSALGKMVELGLKLARGEELGAAAQEGYLPTGVRRPVVRDRPAWERAIDMLEARVSGEPFQSEVLLQQYETVPIPAAIADLGQVKLGLVTSGGLVPRGNPDTLASGFAQEGFRYSIEGLNQLAVSDWESVHGGFNTQILNTKSPSYVLPLPALRELEEEGKIGSIYPFFHSTVGNGTAVTCAKQIGEQIAEEFREAQIGAALLVATWGSCNRCGATISKELAREGINVAMISAIPVIPSAAEVSRVVRGMRVEHVCGDPNLSEESDRQLMRRIVETALQAMQTEVTGPTIFDPDQSPGKEEAHAS